MDTKPAFREAFQRRRCLVPLDGFYEWKKTGTGKQPYAIALKDRRLIGLAGLWETWRSLAGGRADKEFTIVTTTPNKLCAELHNRMPWCSSTRPGPSGSARSRPQARDLKAMLVPCDSDDMISSLASTPIGTVKNNDPSLIEAIGTA